MRDLGNVQNNVKNGHSERGGGILQFARMTRRTADPSALPLLGITTSGDWQGLAAVAPYLRE